MNLTDLSVNNLFFELIRVSIGVSGCLSKTPTNEEWKQLYETAKKQSLVGVCFAGVQRLQLQEQCPPEMLYLTWLGMAAKIQQRNEVVNRQCAELQARLSVDGFHSYIMKGQAIASLYKVSEGFKFQKVSGGSINDNSSNNSNLSQLRQSGDIDIYLDGGFEKVNEYVQRTYPTKEINELEIHYPCFPDTEVEIHFKPFVMDGLKDRILQRFFDSCKEENFSNKVSLGFSGFQEVSGGRLEICAPTLKFNLVHQLVHIHHHLFYEGVGMRQLMDYYFVLRDAQTKGFNGFQEVSKVVSSLGLDRVASALMWVIAYVFDGNNHMKPAEGAETLKPSETASCMPWKPNEKDGRFLLEEIMQSGNFGKQDERQRGLYDSKWNSFWMVHMKTFRMWRFDHWAWLWSPIWRIKGFVWRKLKGYK